MVTCAPEAAIGVTAVRGVMADPTAKVVEVIEVIEVTEVTEVTEVNAVIEVPEATEVIEVIELIEVIGVNEVEVEVGTTEIVLALRGAKVVLAARVAGVMMTVTGDVKQDVIVALLVMTGAVVTMFATILLIGAVGATVTVAKAEVVAGRYHRQGSLIARSPHLRNGRMQRDSCLLMLPTRGSSQMIA